MCCEAVRMRLAARTDLDTRAYRCRVLIGEQQNPQPVPNLALSEERLVASIIATTCVR